LLKIPTGQLSTYGGIAAKINNPHASRAAGTAINSNPVAFLIPCHRVIQSTGSYRRLHVGKYPKIYHY
jgi:AraC family transcriptional regulator of adaptative response/methylated-DNA-[protein]-cysteine methyltransferase